MIHVLNDSLPFLRILLEVLIYGRDMAYILKIDMYILKITFRQKNYKTRHKLTGQNKCNFTTLAGKNVLGIHTSKWFCFCLSIAHHSV